MHSSRVPTRPLATPLANCARSLPIALLSALRHQTRQLYLGTALEVTWYGKIREGKLVRKMESKRRSEPCW